MTNRSQGVAVPGVRALQPHPPGKHAEEAGRGHGVRGGIMFASDESGPDPCPALRVEQP